MEKNDLDSAAESAEYFFDLYEYSMVALDTQALEALVSQDCGFCTNAINQIAKMTDKGQRFQEGAFNLSEPIVFPDENEPGTAEVYFYLDQEGAQVLGHDDEIIEEYPAESLATKVDLEYSVGSWRVTEVVGETEPE